MLLATFIWGEGGSVRFDGGSGFVSVFLFFVVWGCVCFRVLRVFGLWICVALVLYWR